MRLLYIFATCISFCVRQLLLPNPFQNIKMGVLINLLTSSVLSFIGYRIVGLFYTKGDAPVIGSLLFLVVYFVLNVEVYVAFMLYPSIWLVAVLLVLFLALDYWVIRGLNKIM